MSETDHYFTPFNDRFDLTTFDCRPKPCNRWLLQHAATAVRAGTAVVYLLVGAMPEGDRVVGYHAIAPTCVVRQELPSTAAGGTKSELFEPRDCSVLTHSRQQSWTHQSRHSTPDWERTSKLVAIR